MFKYILYLIYKLLLSLISWKYLSSKQLNKLSKIKRSVIVLFHTIYADFYLRILYPLSFHEEYNSVKNLVKPPFNIQDLY